MNGGNFSITKCSLSKKIGDQVVDIKITNQNEGTAKSFEIAATDQNTQAALNVFLDGKVIDQITIEPSSSIVVQIDVTNAHDLYDLALSSNSGGGGMSIKQSSSTLDQGKKYAVEIVLR